MVAFLSLQCIALNGRNGLGHLCLAKAYLALDEVKHSDKATDALEKCLRYNPKCTEAQQLMVRQVRLRHRQKTEPLVNDNKLSIASDKSATAEQKEDGESQQLEEEHKGVLRCLLTEVAITFGIDGLYRDALQAYHRQPSELQLLIKIVLLVLCLRLVGAFLQLICWLLFLPITIVAATTSFIAPELASGGLLTMLVIGGIAYWCHRNNINPFLALFALNLAEGNRRGNNRDILMAAGVYEMVKDGNRRPQDRVHHDPYYYRRGPYYHRWYHWHYWW